MNIESTNADNLPDSLDMAGGKPKRAGTPNQMRYRNFLAQHKEKFRNQPLGQAMKEVAALYRIEYGAMLKRKSECAMKYKNMEDCASNDCKWVKEHKSKNKAGKVHNVKAFCRSKNSKSGPRKSRSLPSSL